MRRIVVLVLAVASAGAAYVWWNSPERQISRILTAVDAAFSHEEPGTGLDALTAVAGLQRHLATDVSIDIGRGAGPVTGRQEVVSLAARIRAASPMMRLQWFDPEIVLESDTQATVRATAQVTTADASGVTIVDVHQVHARVEQREGAWVVVTARREPGRENGR